MAARRWWALAALVAVAVGVAAGELVAALFSPALSPVTAVGSAVIDAMPPGVKDWAVGLFGTADKAVFLATMLLIMAAAAAALGLLERWRRYAGMAGIAVFGALGVAAVATRAGFRPDALAAPVVAAGVGVVLQGYLLGKYPGADRRPGGAGAAGAQSAGPTARPAAPPSRRSFLQAVAIGSVLAAVGGLAAAALRGAAVGVATVRAALTLPAPTRPAAAVPAGAQVQLAGVEPVVTPNADFYRIDTALVVPAVDPSSWTLKVTGMVDHPLELDFATLLAKPMVEHFTTIACVSNYVGGDLVGNARWLGWPVRELLAEAGVQPGADMVLSRSTDGFTAGTPLEAMTDLREAIIAVGMNGEPLPLEHGFPARLIVPGLYGYVSATKWLAELKATRFADDAGYWTPRGWSALGPIKTASRIDVPRDGYHVAAGTVALGGEAWAPQRGISAVQLRVDRGPWQDAALAPAINADTWVQWSIQLAPGSGRHEFQVRATDGAGVPQTEDRAEPAPDGATGFHTITLTVG
ncbi:molybdopterin-dependent oxidoreductase [Pseudarthrobacter sp. P1]|uniref:molybdopterin-dependent oxidoreductase n=1 Tax=Pseudarthrobacter sp. P1 TaxID=3418418 RepID=UPI003CFA5647